MRQGDTLSAYGACHSLLRNAALSFFQDVAELADVGDVLLF